MNKLLLNYIILSVDKPKSFLEDICTIKMDLVTLAQLSFHGHPFTSLQLATKFEREK